MLFPKKITAGGCIGLVSPSSPITEERLILCINKLKEMGFTVKVSDNITENIGGYMAGDPTKRGYWINQMFADPEVDAIFCVRGGDTANRIMEYIDTDVVKSNPKIFVGFSDVTSLHLLFNQECNLVTFHGPMVSSNFCCDFDNETKVAFFSCLNAENEYTYVPPKGLPIEVARSGKAEGTLIGGNLTVLCASIGTPYQIETEGKILFIEEIDGHIGNIDRNIFQLKNAGLLDKVNGIILGQFAECRCDVPDYDIKDVVLDATKNLDIPIFYNIQSGHGHPMITLPLGAVCKMDSSIGTISFEMA